MGNNDLQQPTNLHNDKDKDDTMASVVGGGTYLRLCTSLPKAN